MGTVQTLNSKCLRHTYSGRTVSARTQRNNDAERNSVGWRPKIHSDDAVNCWESLESLWGVFLKKTFVYILTKFK